MHTQRRSVAIGWLAEFLVIVVGVLVALATDRWMQTRDDYAVAESYHERLIAELVADSIRLEGLQDEASARANEAREMLPSIQRWQRGDRSGEPLINFCFAATACGNLPTIDATVREMQTTGTLQLFPADPDSPGQEGAPEALTDRVNQVPGIEGIVTGAVAYQQGSLAVLIDAQWMPALVQTLALVRASPPR